MSNVYETRRLVNEYLLFHYGSDEELLPYGFGPTQSLHFPIRTVHQTLDYSRIPDQGARALDLGCAVGRSSFELSRFCEEVIGIDYSAAFISAADTLKNDGALEYEMLEEGARTTTLTATVPEDIDRARVHFETGDAHKLRADLGRFDIIHAANLLCRLHSPVSLLTAIPSLLRPGGQLVLTTPCTWLAEYTVPENWLGGSPDKPEQSTLSSLISILEPRVTLAWQTEMPFLIRETARKFQWTVAQASRWILPSS